MSTNRKRRMRTSNKIPLTFSEEYLGELRARYFLEESLTEEELAIVIPYDRKKTDEYIKLLELAGSHD